MKYLLFIVIFIGLGAVIGSIMIGSMTFEGTVTDQPYETGLRWDEIMKIRNSVKIEILNNRFYVGENNIQFTISSGREMDQDFKIHILLTRPGNNKYDQEFLPLKTSNNNFIVKINIPEYGYWDLLFKFKHDHKEVVIPKRIYAEQ